MKFETLQNGSSQAQTESPDHEKAQEQPARLTVRLRDHGRLGIATVVHAQPAHSGLTRYGLEIDTINAPKRFLTVLQALPGESYEVEDRVYILADPKDERIITILPVSATGGVKLPRSMNRLDPYVLGPLLLHTGIRGTAQVLEAQRLPLGYPELEARGFSRFQLLVRIEPANGNPAFQAQQQITLTSPEKIQRMATPGVILPIRYDALQPQSFTTDSLAMGYPDPYAETLAVFRENIKSTQNVG